MIDCKINSPDGQTMTKRLYPVGSRMLMDHNNKFYANNTGTEEGAIEKNYSYGVPILLSTNSSDIYLPEA